MKSKIFLSLLISFVLIFSFCISSFAVDEGDFDFTLIDVNTYFTWETSNGYYVPLGFDIAFFEEDNCPIRTNAGEFYNWGIIQNRIHVVDPLNNTVYTPLYELDNTSVDYTGTVYFSRIYRGLYTVLLDIGNFAYQSVNLNNWYDVSLLLNTPMSISFELEHTLINGNGNSYEGFVYNNGFYERRTLNSIPIYNNVVYFTSLPSNFYDLIADLIQPVVDTSSIDNFISNSLLTVKTDSGLPATFNNSYIYKGEFIYNGSSYDTMFITSIPYASGPLKWSVGFGNTGWAFSIPPGSSPGAPYIYWYNSLDPGQSFFNVNILSLSCSNEGLEVLNSIMSVVGPDDPGYTPPEVPPEDVLPPTVPGFSDFFSNIINGSIDILKGIKLFSLDNGTVISMWSIFSSLIVVNVVIWILKLVGGG